MDATSATPVSETSCKTTLANGRVLVSRRTKTPLKIALAIRTVTVLLLTVHLQPIECIGTGDSIVLLLTRIAMGHVNAYSHT